MRLKPKILLIEDDQHVADQVIDAGKAEQWSIDWVSDREKAFQYALNNSYDLMILDRMLGDGKDAIELIEVFRGQELNMPAIILSTLGGALERINGLNAGADIYMEKPFVSEELIAGVNALLRRQGFSSGESAIFQYGELELRLYSRTALWQKSELTLRPLSFNILEILARRHGQIISKQELWKKAWPTWHADPQNDVMDQAIFRLRQELGNVTKEVKIITKRYRGFYIEISN